MNFESKRSTFQLKGINVGMKIVIFTA